MKNRLVCTAVACALTLPGCSVVKKDLHSAGGYSGSVLDKHMFDASGSKQLQVLRAALIVAMVARAGTAYSRPGGEGGAYTQAIVDAVDQINILAGHVDPGQKSPPHGKLACQTPAAGGTVGTTSQPPCATYAVNFESDIPLMERAVFRLTVIALPQDQARSFLGSLKTGDALSAAWKAAKLAFAAANGLHSAAAVNRTAREVTAHQVSGRSPKTIGEALAVLGLKPGEIFKAPTAALSPTVDPQVMAAVMRNIKDSCLLVPLNSTAASAAEDAKAREDLCDQIKYEPKARFSV